MLVTIVSECEDKALIQTRKILCKYLPQIGSRTWAGKISEEGLEYLALELNKSATKNSSIACYRNFGTKKLNYIWHIGSESSYFQGHYAFKTSSKLDMLKELKTMSIYQSILRDLIKMAGLLHDIGKNNLGFQEKLHPKSQNKSDYVRHEFFSFLILDKLIKFIQGYLDKKDSDFNDEDFFSHCANTELLNKFFMESITLNDIEKANIREKYFDIRPFTTALTWLVASHHKLTTFDNEDWQTIKFDKLKNNNHVRTDNEKQKYITYKDKHLFLNEKYVKSLSSLAKNIIEKTKSTDMGIFKTSIIYYLPYYARPILIYADYVASKNKNISTEGWGKNIVANSQDGLPADNLLVHLDKTKNHAHNLYNGIFNYHCLVPSLKYLVHDELPTKIRECLEYVKITRENNFSWQQQAVNILLNSENNPTFAVILASTGTGKTWAIPKIMASLKTDTENYTRYTLCLGYRSLTMQTQKSYEDIGFKKRDFATIIGGQYSEAIYNASNNSTNDDIKETDGSSNELFDQSSELFQVNFGASNSMFLQDTEKDFKLIFNNKDYRAVMCSPIVISTIDHFIDCGSLERGAQSLMQLRLMTSDLVLDEIDSYSDEQLIVISRLVFLTGLYGKNIILVSATINPIIVENFFNLYMQGLNKYHKFNDTKEVTHITRICLFSNFVDVCKVFNLKDSGEFINIYKDKFIKPIVNKQQDKKALRRLDILTMSNIDNDSNVFELILNKIYTLHDLNHEVAEGQNLSIGFVKFNDTELTINFAEFLLKTDLKEDYSILVLSYHAKLMLVHRILNEQFLNKLKRDKKTLYQIPDVKTRIRNIKAKNIIIIVSTSPIIETGIDQDYDWAVLEPTSTRSLIQASGRVKRHRSSEYLKANQFNISLIEFPHRCEWGKNLKPNDELYKHPGVEDNFKVRNIENDCRRINPLISNSINDTYLKDSANILNISYNTQSSERIYSATNVFNQAISSWKDKINQNIAIDYSADLNYSPISAYELIRQQIFLPLLNDKLPPYLGQTNYILIFPLLMLNANHFYQNLLRDKNENKLIYWIDNKFYENQFDQELHGINNVSEKKIEDCKNRLFILEHHCSDLVINDLWNKFFSDGEANRGKRFKNLTQLQISYQFKNYEYNFLGLRRSKI